MANKSTHKQYSFCTFFITAKELVTNFFSEFKLNLNQFRPEFAIFLAYYMFLLPEMY